MLAGHRDNQTLKSILDSQRQPFIPPTFPSASICSPQHTHEGPAYNPAGKVDEPSPGTTFLPKYRPQSSAVIVQSPRIGLNNDDLFQREIIAPWSVTENSRFFSCYITYPLNTASFMAEDGGYKDLLTFPQHGMYNERPGRRPLVAQAQEGNPESKSAVSDLPGPIKSSHLRIVPNCNHYSQAHQLLPSLRSTPWRPY